VEAEAIGVEAEVVDKTAASTSLLARYVKLSVYKHDRAKSGTTHSGSVYSAS